MALVAANAVPIFGALAFDWSLGDLMILYWLESAIIGIYNILKMSIAGGAKAFFFVPFFTVHYGGFMAGHLVFILVLFAGPKVGTPSVERFLDLLRTAAVPAISLVASHGVSFATNFVGKREYAEADIEELFGAPYKRIVLMHVTIIFGGFIVIALGSPAPVLLLLIVLKTAVDLRAHMKEHGPRVPK